jgi:hypothetical protein
MAGRRLFDNLGGRSTGKLLAVTVLFLILYAAVDSPALAHTEGKMQLSAEPAGPYKVTAFTSPDPATTGELHVAALVFLAEDASPILEAQVTVQLQNLDSGVGPITIPAALGDSENKLLFEAVANIKEPGDYSIVIEIDEENHGHGSASFVLEVISEGGFNWLILAPIIAALLAIAFWLFRRSRHSVSARQVS